MAIFDFSLRDLWWLKPPRDDDVLPALKFGADIARNKAAQDLKEKELVNDFARTSLMREEMLYKQELKMQLTAGNAALAKTISEVNDWSDPAEMAKVYETISNNPMTFGSKGATGAEYMHRSAVTAKRLRDQALAQSGVSEAVTIGVDEEGNPIQENFVRFGNKVFRSTQHKVIEDPKSGKRFMKSPTGALHSLDDNDDAISTNPDTGEQYVEALPILDKSGKQVGLGYRGAKGNIIRLPKEDATLSQGEKVRYELLKDELDAAEKADIAKTPSHAERLRKLYDLKRRELQEKYFPKPARTGLKTEDRTTNAPPAVVAPASPMPATKEELVKDQIYQTPRGRAKWDGEKFIPQ